VAAVAEPRQALVAADGWGAGVRARQGGIESGAEEERHQACQVGAIGRRGQSDLGAPFHRSQGRFLIAANELDD
jgi:hypothetical protein